ncbi:hypothetical protein KRP22_008241 [Phytophthora ramorum]|nr:hypothetical protein KRP22_3748 [Phytophthora ramorum]
MGCTQSKTNEVVDPIDTSVESTVAPIEISADEVSADVTEQAPVEAAESVEAEAEPASVKQEPTVEVRTPDSILEFVSGEVSVNEYGVAFYNFDGINLADPSKELHVCKRFSEFKDMHAAMSKLMASEKNVKTEDQDKFQTYPALPAMPRANAVTYVLGRGNQGVVKEREVQFVRILNAIARHPIAVQSRAFNDFLA